MHRTTMSLLTALGAVVLCASTGAAPAVAQFAAPTFCTGQTATGGFGAVPQQGGLAGTPSQGCTTQTGELFCATDGPAPSSLSRTSIFVTDVDGIGAVLRIDGAPLLRNDIDVNMDGVCPNVRDAGNAVLAGRACRQHSFSAAYCLLGGVQQVRVDTGTRDDKIDSRDALPGRIDCGSGSDVATIDLKDTAIDCESVSQAAVVERPNVWIASRAVRITSGRTVTITLACPRATREGCEGRIQLDAVADRLRRLAEQRYARIRPGGRDTVSVPLSTAARARLRRLTTVRVTSVESGERGPKTTWVTLPRR